jgi:integrase/recombinase XerD
MNVHPFKNESEARLICNLRTGSPITPKSLWNLMEQPKIRIIRLMKNGEIADEKENLRLDYLLKTKKWNPYCIRYSSITADSDYLTEYALKKKVRWSMNSKQGTRYIKNRYGNDLKNRILEQNGIKSQEYQAPKSVNINCPRCELVNANGNKYCSACGYPLLQDALEESKRAEEERLLALEEKYAQKFSSLEQTLEKKIKLLFFKLKPELLTLDN